MLIMVVAMVINAAGMLEKGKDGERYYVACSNFAYIQVVSAHSIIKMPALWTY